MIKKGVEASVRYFQPRFAIMLRAYGSVQNMLFIDYANLVPDTKAEVTYK